MTAPTTNTQAIYDELLAVRPGLLGELPTSWLTHAALNLTVWGTDNTPMWRGIAATQEDAEAYYASLDEEELRSEAATILAHGGWTRSAICFRRS